MRCKNTLKIGYVFKSVNLNTEEVGTLHNIFNEVGKYREGGQRGRVGQRSREGTEGSTSDLSSSFLAG